MPANAAVIADIGYPVIPSDQLFSSTLTYNVPTSIVTPREPVGGLGPLLWPFVVEQRLLSAILPDPPLAMGALNRVGAGLIRNEAGIATPMGEWIPTFGVRILLNPFNQSTVRFAYVGVTRDNTGAPLGNCTVRAHDVGRLTVAGIESEVGDTVSDGSGAYTLPVGYNVPHQLTAYLAGAPDRAGISVISAVPDAVG